MTKIAPSLLAADFTQLGKQGRAAVDGGADMLHFDVMDGVFVPNISIGVPVLQSMAKSVKAVYDVHLMIQKPHKYIQAFRDAGADIITVHLEACEDIAQTITQIKQSGAKAGLSIKPDTPPQAVFEYLKYIDMVLVMSVEPGFGGQAFMPKALDKIKKIKAEIIRCNLSVDIEVDGGINIETAALCVNAGADILVAGSAVFNAPSPAEIIRQLKGE